MICFLRSSHAIKFSYNEPSSNSLSNEFKDEDEINLLNYKLNENLLPIGTMLKEAQPLLNNNFLKKIDIKVSEKNIKWYIKTTKDSLEVI